MCMRYGMLVASGSKLLGRSLANFDPIALSDIRAPISVVSTERDQVMPSARLTDSMLSTTPK